MVMVKDLTQVTLKDLWKEVKDEEDWWGDINERVLGMVKLILESSLEEELLEELQVSRYKRSITRRGYRNGHYPRDLYTMFGVIKSLRVPRAREHYIPGYYLITKEGRKRSTGWSEVCFWLV